MPVCGKTSSGGGEGGVGSWTTIATRPWHGCAQHTKGRVNLVPPPAAEGPEGGKEKAYTGVATMGFSITHGSWRALTQIQTEWGSLCPILSQWEEVPWG